MLAWTELVAYFCDIVKLLDHSYLTFASMFCFMGKECLLLQKEQKACLKVVQSYLFGDNIFGAVGTQAFLT